MDTRIQFRNVMSHDAWLTEQVNLAFAKLDSGDAVYFNHEKAKSSMAERKARIRSRSKA